MFIIIGIWGARERRINAAYYFFLYTLFGSLFILFGILYFYTIVETNDFKVLLNLILLLNNKYFYDYVFLYHLQ